MQNQFKVVELWYKTKTVSQHFDPTSVRKNTDMDTVIYCKTLDEAVKDILSLEEQKRIGDEMDHSWGAPPECFENKLHPEWYIVNMRNGKWLQVWEHPDTGKAHISKVKPPILNGWVM